MGVAVIVTIAMLTIIVHAILSSVLWTLILVLPTCSNAPNVWQWDAIKIKQHAHVMATMDATVMLRAAQPVTQLTIGSDKEGRNGTTMQYAMACTRRIH